MFSPYYIGIITFLFNILQNESDLRFTIAIAFNQLV